MPTTRSEKVRRPRDEVRPFVEYLVAHMPECSWVIGGSWRRKAQEIGDLDILITTEDGTFGDLDLRLGGAYLIEKSGSAIIQGDLCVRTSPQPEGDHNTSTSIGMEKIHLDMWCCQPKQAGGFLMFITGPKALNIHQRQVAISKGFTLSQYGLLDQAGHQVDFGSEIDIYSRLGMPWLRPEDRQQFAEHAPKKSTVRKWLAPSDSDPNQTYNVQRIDDEPEALWTCTCPAFKYSKQLPARCKHILRAQQGRLKEIPCQPE